MTFFTFTFVVPYWASSALHFIPWRIRVAHDIALVLDFLGISGGFAAQTVAWVGKGWWNVSLDDGFEVRVDFPIPPTVYCPSLSALRPLQLLATVSTTCITSALFTAPGRLYY